MDLLTLAKNVAQRVEAQATQAKVPVAVCVVDVHGNVVLQHRMPGAPLCDREGAAAVAQIHQYILQSPGRSTAHDLRPFTLRAVLVVPESGVDVRLFHFDVARKADV